MPLLTPQLPLSFDGRRGYRLIEDYVSLVKQNFKNLIMTNSGERMMDPSFGVGIKSFLFQSDSPMLYSDITSKIKEQTNRYLPYLNIENITFNSQELDSGIDDHFLSVVIVYRIVPLDLSDVIEITTPIN